MIISRSEFHQRFMGNLKAKESKIELWRVDRLFKEIKEDAEFRSHNFMFSGDFEHLEAQEQDGLKELNFKTEKERCDFIRKQLIDQTYEPIPILRDIDSGFFYVNNGFHRIFLAKQMGIKSLKCKVDYGDFNLHKNINFKDLTVLLDMLIKMFPDLSLKQIKYVLEQQIKEDKSNGTRHSIGYGALNDI